MSGTAPASDEYLVVQMLMKRLFKHNSVWIGNRIPEMNNGFRIEAVIE